MADISIVHQLNSSVFVGWWTTSRMLAVAFLTAPKNFTARNSWCQRSNKEQPKDFVGLLYFTRLSATIYTIPIIIAHKLGIV
ncbi:hypothetical protein J4462_00975 [Candidatus Pacearchaeota archaeon]|nr:hypothetical protein [Candidatus Pacearchaeota archaeon]